MGDSARRITRQLRDALTARAWDRVTSDLTIGLSRYPEEPMLLGAATDALTALGDIDTAIGLAQRMVSVDPRNDVGYLRLALLSAIAGEEAHAQRALRTMRDARVQPTRDSPLAIRAIAASEGVRGLWQNYPLSAHPDSNGWFRRTSPPPGDREFLFVTGIARSGTSASRVLVNHAGEAAIFNELYSPWRYYRTRSFSTAAVQRQVKTKRPRLGNADVLQRLPRSRVAGDKRPGLFYVLEPTMRKGMSGTKTRALWIYRHVCDVARSWDSRAQSPEDLMWAPTWTGAAARLETRVVDTYLMSLRRPTNDEFDILVVDSDRFCYDAPFTLRTFDMLGLTLSHDERARLSSTVEEASRRLARFTHCTGVDCDTAFGAALKDSGGLLPLALD